MKTITREQIESVLPAIDLLPAIEDGFTAYSEGRAVVPPVGELLLDKGEVHIKYGYVRGEDYYVIKIASGFYDNPKAGLPSGNGMMLLYHQNLSIACLRELAQLLADAGKIADRDLDDHVTATIERLRCHFGVRLSDGTKRSDA